MNKYIVCGVLAIFIISMALVLADKPDLTAKGHGKVAIPADAVEISPNVFSLGTKKDKDGKVVEGFAFIDYKKEFANKGGSVTTTSTCYSFIGKSTKWKKIENWIVNAANTKGLDTSFILNNLDSSINKWENAAGKNIFGTGSLTNDVLAIDTSSPDGKNEVYFGDISSQGAIAVTIVWGRFYGPLSQRELVEWDQIYDQVDFDWSSSGEANKMDFENINAHELGHSFGMGHPSDGCTEETMFRFADYGETKKRDLNAGDKAGIKKLYN